MDGHLFESALGAEGVLSFVRTTCPLETTALLEENSLTAALPAWKTVTLASIFEIERFR